MNPTWEDPIADEEGDENDIEKNFPSGRDAVIFLVDATSDMFQTDEEECPFQLCLKCARMTLTNKIISNNKDLTGIVLFGTDKTRNTRNEADFKHIYVYHDLCEPSADRILETEDLMNMHHQAFETKFGHSQNFSLADALWLCSIMFSNSKSTLSHKRILLFTSTDDPHSGNQQLQDHALTKARDLHESSIDIDLMHICTAKKSFDISKFYKDIAIGIDDESCKIPDACNKFDDLLTRVRCKEHRKRPLGNLNFAFNKDISVSFKMFKLVVSTNKPCAVKLAKDSNAELTTLTNTFLSDTGEILLPSDLKKFQEYSGKRIYMTDDEVKQIKIFDDPGLLLIGFKPLSCIKLHYHFRTSTFLYPDEQSIGGSTRLTLALIIQCIKRKVVPICRLISHLRQPPRFVALFPQEEKFDKQGIQIIPPGFHVVTLPFMEDIRNFKINSKHNPSEEQVQKAKEIISKLQFAYHPENFENPVLQKHWRNIEALALNRDAPEEIIDYTMPKNDIIEKRAGNFIDEFKSLLCAADIKSEGICNATNNPRKKTRIDEASVPLCLRQEAACNALSRYKVNDLKDFCKRNNIKCGSKKADLIEAITIFYNSSN